MGIAWGGRASGTCAENLVADHGRKQGGARGLPCQLLAAANRRDQRRGGMAGLNSTPQAIALADHAATHERAAARLIEGRSKQLRSE